MRRVFALVAVNLVWMLNFKPTFGQVASIDFEQFPTGTILSNQMPGISFRSLPLVTSREMYPTSGLYPEVGQKFAYAIGSFEIQPVARVEGWINFEINLLDQGGLPLFSAWNGGPEYGPQVYALEWSNGFSMAANPNGFNHLEFWREQSGERVPIPFLVDKITYTIVPEPASFWLLAFATIPLVIIVRRNQKHRRF